MELQELRNKAREIRQAYNTLNRIEGYKTWGANEYAQGLSADIGDLHKLLMAKKGFAFTDKNIDEKLGRELADCIWGILALADELDVNLEQEISRMLKKLASKISDRNIIRKSKKAII